MNDSAAAKVADGQAGPAVQVPLAGVMGWPVAHSRSPALHGHWLKRYGVAGHYVPLAVRPEHLGQVLHALPRAGFVGVNVTIPHKEAVLALADVVTDRAALIGAANTLTFGPDGKIHADNTDGHGFIANLLQQAPDWRPPSGPAAVIGAGAPPAPWSPPFWNAACRNCASPTAPAPAPSGSARISAPAWPSTTGRGLTRCWMAPLPSSTRPRWG